METTITQDCAPAGVTICERTPGLPIAGPRHRAAAGCLVLLLLLLAGPAARAQAPAWQTAVTAFQNNFISSQIRATAADASGNVYVAGNFTGTIVLGSIGLTSAGNNDAFVAKWSSASGTFVWAQRAGGPLDDYGTGVAVSGASVYLTGYFMGTAAFGGTAPLVSAGGTDVFVAKLADAGPAGSFVWAQRAGGPGSEQANAVAVQGANVYLTGYFTGTAAFGGTAPLVSAGGTDVFVAKLTDAGTAGSFTWAERGGGVINDAATAVAVSGANVYIAGNFTLTVSFGSAFLVSAGYADAFVAKLIDAGPAGSFVWAQRGGGPNFDVAHGAAVSGANVYVVGQFETTASFGPTVLTGTGYDVFVAKFIDAGPAGSVAWAQRGGGPNFDVAYGVAVSGANVYAAGYVVPPASFGPFAFAAPTNTNVGFLASMRDPTLTATRSALSAESVTLAPNPAHGMATVRLPAVPGTATATLTLLDALGRAVRTQQVPLAAVGTTAEVPLAGLAPGLYRLRVQAGGQQASQALAVE